ncbi:MAG: hypothetical protein CL908_14455 [Deltaproteobacteria bacterium]|nr:hypothetical protein [Deltaproteobacteria bacterium]
MTPPRGRGLRPGGVVRAFGRLALLVGVGFGAGLLIGIVSEEPELLAGHLRGDGESVSLSSQGTEEIDREEDVTAPASQPAADGRSLAAQAVVEPDRARPLPAVAAPAGARARVPDTPVASSAGGVARASRLERRWAVQVGAFSDRGTAARLAEGLGEKGYPVELVPADGKQRRWRVRVQPVRGELEARAMAERLKRKERLPTWVLPMEAVSR